jgi:hypothetical protein
MVNEDFVNEIAFIYYITHDFPRYGNYKNEDFEEIERKKEEWKLLSEEQKAEIRENALSWIQAYQQRFPDQYTIVSSNWKKIDW